MREKDRKRGRKKEKKIKIEEVQWIANVLIHNNNKTTEKSAK